MSENRFLERFRVLQRDREGTLVKYRDNLIVHLKQEISGKSRAYEIESQLVPLRLCTFDQMGQPIYTAVESELEENRQILIVGPAGSGKSTLLKYLALLSAQGLLENVSNIPVLIQLSRFNPTDSLKDKIQQEIRTYAHMPMKPEELTKLLDQGRILLLLDGLNETTDLDIAARKVSSFAQQFPLTYVVVTNRQSVQVAELDFSVFHIAPMSDADIRRIIDYWSSDRPILAESFWNILEENSTLKSLARNPFLLRLILKLYDRQDDLPLCKSAISEAYLRSFLPSLLRKLPHSYGLLTEQIALHMYLVKKLNVSYEEIAEQAEYIATQSSERIDLDDAIDALHKSGLLEKLENTFCFAHQILQEYFCVQALANLDRKELEAFINEHAGDAWWEQVLILLLKQRPDANEIISSFIKSDKASHWLLAAKLVTEGIEANRSLRLKVTRNLCSLLDDKSPQETIRAANFLAKFSERETSEICRDWLLRKSDDPLSSTSLVFILASQGEKDDTLYRFLLPTIRNESADVRYQACRALGAIDTKQSTELLINWLREEKDYRVLQQILSSLNRTRCLPNQVQSTDLAQLLAELWKLERTSEDPDIRAWTDLLTRKLAKKSSEVEV